MLREKVKRYKRQYAHNLALEGMTDIALKWKCNEMGPQVYFLPADEMAYVNIAVRSLESSMHTNADLELAQVYLQVHQLGLRALPRVRGRIPREATTR